MKTKTRIFTPAIIAAMLLPMGGCDEKSDIGLGENNITITVANQNATTRLHHNDNQVDAIELSWTDTDKLKLYTNKQGKDFAITNILFNGRMAEFNGNLPQGNGPYSIVYPASKATDNWQNNVLYITGQAQNGDATTNHLADYNYMVLTDIQDLEGVISFKNNISILKFNVVLPDGKSIIPLSAELSVPPSENTKGIAAGYIPATGEYIYAGSVNMELKDFSEAGAFTIYMAVFKIEELTNMQFSVYGSKLSYHYTITGIDQTSYEQGNSYAGKIEANEDAGVQVVIKVEEGHIFDNDIAELTAVDESWPGEGTSGSPYEIGSARMLKKLILDVNSGWSYSDTHFKLTSNIHVTADEWTTIGNEENFPFAGIFDGNDKTISGQLISREWNREHFGFFGNLVDGAKVSNLTITANVEGNERTGAIVGYIDEGNETVEITNCTFSGQLKGGDDTGGIVGVVKNPQTIISNCISSGLVNGNAYRTGGIAGTSYGTIKECINYTSVMGAKNDVAGICGYNYGTVEKCKNYGAINGVDYNGCIVAVTMESSIVRDNVNYGKITGRKFIGGIVGLKEYDYSENIETLVVGNTNHGSVTATGDYIGGIVGYIRDSGKFGNNINNGKVTSSYARANIGGIVGYNQRGIIYTCNQHTSGVPVNPIGYSYNDYESCDGTKDADCPYCTEHK